VLGVGGGGVAAAALDGGEEGALGGDGEAVGWVVDGSDELAGVLVIGAALDGEGALAGGGEHFFEAEDLGGLGLTAEALERGEGEDGGVVLGFLDFADAGFDVAADGADLEVGAEGAKLGLTPGGAGPDDGAGWKGTEGDAGTRNEDIARVMARRDGSDDETFGAVAGEVFEAVDGDIDFAALEGFLDGGGEPAGALAFGEGRCLVGIACGGDGDDLDGEAGRDGLEAAGDEVRLGEGEGAAAGTEAEDGHAGMASRRAWAAACTVASIWASLCARETNQVSNWDGGMRMPRERMARWKRAKAAVSDWRASA